MPCGCCQDCVPCLCNPSVLGLDLILFGGSCPECDFPLGIRIPLLLDAINFPIGNCIGWGMEQMDGCRWCWMSALLNPFIVDPPECGPVASLHCFRGNNLPSSYAIIISGLSNAAPTILWHAQSVTCDPFELTFDSSFGQFVYPQPGGDGCSGSYPTSALVVPHV